jgi:soluble lytic murein transglycosylase-like protein
MRPVLHPCLFAALAALCAAPLAHAGPRLYSWTDKDGVLHMDENPPTSEELRAAGRPLKRLPPERQSSAKGKVKAQAKAARKEKPRDWWERSNDAPPDEIDKAAKYYNIPAELIRAVIAIESAGNAAAKSGKGAVGLMQLMPGTAGSMYVDDPVDPRQNIQGGTRYLRTLANQYNGDLVLVLAAYNAGPDAVKKYGGVPPFAETRDYVRRVLAKFNQYKLESARRGPLAAADRAQPQSENRP